MSVRFVSISLVFLGFLFQGNDAFSDNHVACWVKCSKRGPDGKTVTKEHQCNFAIPPGVSFGIADCQSQCQTQCANIIYGKFEGKAPPSNQSSH